MSPTAAVQKSAREHSDIIRRSSTDYVFYGPVIGSNASVQVQRCDYFRARSARTSRVACYALHLLGFDVEAADNATHGKPGTAAELVRAAVKARGER